MHRIEPGVRRPAAHPTVHRTCIGHHATRKVCARDAVPFKPPKHVDSLTGPGHRIRCVERRRLNGRCLHVQVSVVRDHDGSFLVDLETEPDLGPGPDTLQQYRAQTVPGLAERGAILARWPRGAWHDMRVCPDEDRVYHKRVHVPSRYQLLLDRYAGKPHPGRFDRPGERGCLVAVNTTGQALAIDVSIPPPAQGETRKHFRHSETGTFPLCTAPRSARRWSYGLTREWATAWHVAHTVVLTPEAQAGCRERKSGHAQCPSGPGASQGPSSTRQPDTSRPPPSRNGRPYLTGDDSLADSAPRGRGARSSIAPRGAAPTEPSERPTGLAGTTPFPRKRTAGEPTGNHGTRVWGSMHSRLQSGSPTSSVARGRPPQSGSRSTRLEHGRGRGAAREPRGRGAAVRRREAPP